VKRDRETLRRDALQIWRAGVEAVRPANLIPHFVTVEGNTLQIGDDEFNLRTIQRIVVVGAGKAGASMTIALENALGSQVIEHKQVTGWINVPADCLEDTQAIQLHAGRPAGINEPTEAGVTGTQAILRLVQGLGPRDLCICLISGGGSALLPAPVEGLSLADKIALTREIAARGGNIQQLNIVRREFSKVKGGGLARACRAGHLVSLILSDVLGDDLSVIASGPTVLRAATPELAIQVLEDFDLQNHSAGQTALGVLRNLQKNGQGTLVNDLPQVTNIVIGNNATAVDAAGIEAERLGYSHAMISAPQPEGAAEDVAAHLVEMAKSMRTTVGPDCLISGGEPTVKLCESDNRGLGGRNQQLALAALTQVDDWQGIGLVSGGTDGEDGPTDAAGAIVDEEIARQAQELQLNADSYLARNDAYHFFEKVNGLIKTGPTHTNVCDLRVVTVSQSAAEV
jgi:hydroxypyruvate reductase